MLEITSPFQTMKSIQELSTPVLLVDSAHLNISLEDFGESATITLYKLWTRMVTNTLYEYAEANCLLSTSQAGFRKQKDTIEQLQNIIMALEDAKFFKQDMYASIVLHLCVKYNRP